MEQQQKKKKNSIEALNHETRTWRSQLHFISDEMKFIEHLLDSYVFEPDTPDLFERLQEYERSLAKCKKRCIEVCDRIMKHENKLGGLLELDNGTLDSAYVKKHLQYEAEVVGFMMEFRELKAAIFNYAGGILKKRHKK
jgi:hypothetical protein